jgi:hypothetical protein
MALTIAAMDATNSAVSRRQSLFFCEKFECGAGTFVRSVEGSFKPSWLTEPQAYGTVARLYCASRRTAEFDYPAGAQLDARK